MKTYEYERVINRRAAIDRYGTLGIKPHREVVYIEAESVKQANDKIRRFNYKKHVKFVLRFVWENAPDNSNVISFGEIIDLGIVE